MGSRLMVSMTVYGLKNFITEVETMKAYAVQMELNSNK